MMMFMQVTARVAVLFGYLLVGYVFYTEGKKRLAERKEDDKKEKNSAEETAE